MKKLYWSYEDGNDIFGILREKLFKRKWTANTNICSYKKDYKLFMKENDEEVLKFDWQIRKFCKKIGYIQNKKIHLLTNTKC